MANLNIGGVPPNLLASSVLTSSELAFIQNLSSRSSYNANNVVILNSANGGLPGQVLRVKSDGSGLEWADAGTGSIGGSISAGQIAFGTGANTIGGDTNLTWDNTAKKLITNALKIGNLSGVLKAITGDVSGGATTDDLPEGTTNLYWTQARFNTAFAGKTTDDLAEGTTNKYFTQSRFDTAFAGKTTDNLTEGTTNLYFTQARARQSISAQAPITYNSSTGVIGLDTSGLVQKSGTPSAKQLAYFVDGNSVSGEDNLIWDTTYKVFQVKGYTILQRNGIFLEGRNGSGNPVFIIYNEPGLLQFHGWDTSNFNFMDVKLDGSKSVAFNAGKVGIGAYPSSEKLEVEGNIKASGNVIGHIAINQQTGTSYTLQLSDDGKLVQMNNSSANTVTIPANSSVAFPIGTKIMVQKYGTGNTTIQGASGVTIRDPNNLATITTQYDTRVLLKIGTNEWVIV